MNDPPTSPVESPPAPIRRRLLDHGLVLFSLSGLAIAQPLLDIYGRNPEAFLANGLSRSDLVLFGLGAVFLVPLVGMALEALASVVWEQAERGVHSVLVGILTALLALGWARQIGLDATLLALAAAAACGVALAVAERRYRQLRTTLHLLAVAPLAFLGLFLFGSEASSLVSAPAAATEASVRFTGEERPPVVWVVLDELPLSTIISTDGKINEERFPQFARLASASHWFRNAHSPAFRTEQAIPPILTGRWPAPDKLPIYTEHPRNLFSLLAGEYEIWEQQPLTDLCPPEACHEAIAQSGGLRRAALDAGVVYGHLVLPADLREQLPSVDSTWGGFLGDEAIQVPESGDDPLLPSWPLTGHDDTPAQQPRVMDALLGDLGSDAARHLWFAHLELPHQPWTLTPLGLRSTSDFPKLGAELQGSTRHVNRSLEARQRHLLQAGVADQLIGALMDQMEQLGVWDEALVVVSADHGHSLRAPDFGRGPTELNAPEVFRVPMFVKLPGQTEGVQSDVNASTMDLLPSLVDVLDINTDWTFDGHSLFDGSPFPSEKRVIGGLGTIDPSFDEFLETIVAAHARDFPRDDWIGVAAVGVLGGSVGDRVDDLEVLEDSPFRATIDEEADLADLDLEAGLVPLSLSGSLEGPVGEPLPEELLLVLNGRVAGVARADWSVDVADTSRFRGLVAEELLVDGRNSVEVLVPRGDGSFWQAG